MYVVETWLAIPQFCSRARSSLVIMLENYYMNWGYGFVAYKVSMVFALAYLRDKTGQWSPKCSHRRRGTPRRDIIESTQFVEVILGTQTAARFGCAVIARMLIEHDAAMGNVEEEWAKKRWGVTVGLHCATRQTRLCNIYICFFYGIRTMTPGQAPANDLLPERRGLRRANSCVRTGSPSSIRRHLEACHCRSRQTRRGL